MTAIASYLTAEQILEYEFIPFILYGVSEEDLNYLEVISGDEIRPPLFNWIIMPLPDGRRIFVLALSNRPIHGEIPTTMESVTINRRQVPIDRLAALDDDEFKRMIGELTIFLSGSSFSQLLNTISAVLIEEGNPYWEGLSEMP